MKVVPRHSVHSHLRITRQPLDLGIVNLDVPIVDDVLTALVGGGSSSSTTQAASAPSTTITGSGSSGGNGNGSSGNNGSGGNSAGSDSGNSNSSSGNSGNSGTSNGSSSSSGASGSSNDSSGSIGGSSSTGGPSSNTGTGGYSSNNSSSGESNQGSSNGSSTGSSTSGSSNSNSGSNSGDSSGSSSSGTTSGGSASGFTQSASSSGIASQNGALQGGAAQDTGLSPNVNVAVVTSVSGGHTSLYSVDSHGSTVVISPTSSSGSTSGVASGESASGSGANKEGGLGGGAIAGIVVCCLVVFVALIVFLMRRRMVAKRAERRHTWWASKLDNEEKGSDVDGTVYASRSRNSVRSSFGTFGTSFEEISNSSFDSIPPAMPAMAEIRGGQPLFAVSPDSPLLPRDLAQVQAMAPLVSPASPSSPAVDLRRASVFSVGSLGSNDSQSPFLDPPMTPITASAIAAFPRPPSQNRPVSETVRPQAPSRYASSTDVHVLKNTEFNEYETILRPFAPTLADELLVEVGDRVKVQKVFDDGWVVVETTARGQIEMGMIPVDCLRAQSQDLPAFLAAKRVSSYTPAAGIPL